MIVKLRESSFRALVIIPAAVTAAGRMRSRSASTLAALQAAVYQLHLPPIIQSTYLLLSAQSRIPAKISNIPMAAASSAKFSLMNLNASETRMMNRGQISLLLRRVLSLSVQTFQSFVLVPLSCSWPGGGGRARRPPTSAELQMRRNCGDLVKIFGKQGRDTTRNSR